MQITGAKQYTFTGYKLITTPWPATYNTLVIKRNIRKEVINSVLLINKLIVYIDSTILFFRFITNKPPFNRSIT
jgi:hypothetical protein